MFLGENHHFSELIIFQVFRYSSSLVISIKALDNPRILQARPRLLLLPCFSISSYRLGLLQRRVSALGEKAFGWPHRRSCSITAASAIDGTAMLGRPESLVACTPVERDGLENSFYFLPVSKDEGFLLLIQWKGSHFQDSLNGFHWYAKLEGYLPFIDFRTQANSLLDRRQVFHQEDPFVCGLLEGHGVLQDLCIFRMLRELDHVAFQVFHQIVVEAISLQDLEGIVPRAGGLELETVFVLIVVVQ